MDRTTTYEEILEIREFNGIADKLGFVPEESFRNKTLDRIFQEQPPFRNAGIIEGLEAAINQINKTSRFYTPLYAEDQNAGLFYFPCGKQNAPFALVIPGGAYAMVATAIEGFPTAARLNKLNINVFVLTYRAAFPAPVGGVLNDALEDLQTALHLIINNAGTYKINPDNYMVIGFSAGGHLASMVNTDTLGYGKAGLPKPGMVGLVYPVVNFHTGGIIDMCRECAFGKKPTEQILNRAYAPNHLMPDSAPLFLIHGRNDTTVPFEVNSAILYKAAKELGIPSRYMEIEDFPHGSGIGSGLEAEKWISAMVDFRRELLR